MLSFVRCIIWRGRVFMRGADDYVWMAEYRNDDLPVFSRLTTSERSGEYRQAMDALFDGDANETP